MEERSVGAVVRETTRRYWSHTNVGGLTQAYHAHGHVFRFVWLLLFCLGTYQTINDLLNVVNDYMANLHTSQMDVVSDRSVSFPAVTICNQNRINCQHLVRAALRNVTYEPLQEIVNSSNCLKESGLDCSYIWRLFVQESLPDNFFRLYRPYCLKCDQCMSFAQWGFGELGRGEHERFAFEKIFAQIGCNSTCGFDFGGSGGHGGGGPGGGGPGGGGPGGGGPGGGGPGGGGPGGGGPGGGGPGGGGPGPGKRRRRSPEGLSQFLEQNRVRRMAQMPPYPDSSGPSGHSGPSGSSGPSGYPGCSGPHCSGSAIKLVSPSQTFNQKMRLMATFMTLPKPMRVKLGNRFEDMIMDCTYLGTDCTDPIYFQEISSPQFGNCFTFNANITPNADGFAGKRQTSLTGELYSLDLLLYLKHYSYPPTLTEKKGARVEIHPPNIMPNIEENGMNVVPNAATAFGIEQTTIKRLRAPYESKCVSNWTEVKYFPIGNPIFPDLIGNEKYDNKRCKKFCLQHHFQQICNCSHPLYPTSDSFRAINFNYSSELRPCNLEYFASDFNCTSDVQNRFDQLEFKCGCPSSCFEFAYTVSSSVAQWPRETYKSTAVSRMGIRVDDLTEDDLENIVTDMLEVKVFFKTLDTSRLEQYPYISEHALLSDIGGAMSLYLGVSLIMIAEIVEFFSTLLYNICYFCTVGKKKSTRIGDTGTSKDEKPSNRDQLSIIADFPAIEKPVYNSPNT